MANGTVKTLKWAIGIVLSALLTGAVALGGWNLSKTASIPERYATKAELKDAQLNDAKERSELKDDVERGLDQVLTEQRAIKKSIDKIVDHLITHPNE